MTDITPEMVEAAWMAYWRANSLGRGTRADLADAIRAAIAVRESTHVDAIRVLERCRTVLGNMALENEQAWWPSARWPIDHEPLRSDARGLLPLIDAVLSAGGKRDE